MLRNDLLIPKTVCCSLVFFHLCLSASLFVGLFFFSPPFSKQHLQTEPSAVSQEGKHRAVKSTLYFWLHLQYTH